MTFTAQIKVQVDGGHVDIKDLQSFLEGSVMVDWYDKLPGEMWEVQSVEVDWKTMKQETK